MASPDQPLGIAASHNGALIVASIAWCAANPNVSTVITGASRPEQVTENLGAVRVLELLDGEVLDRIDAAFAE